MEHLLVAVNAVVPFLIYMAFGYGAKRAGLMEEALARRINSVVFQAFYPVITCIRIRGSGFRREG